MKIDYEKFMREALKEAEKARLNKDYPIGAVIVLDNEIISRGYNQIYSGKNKIAHAEMNAIAPVSKIIYHNPKKATIFTTYEPCPMCYGAIILSKFKELVYGAGCNNSGAVHLKAKLPPLFQTDFFHIEIKSGILEKECKEIFEKSARDPVTGELKKLEDICKK